MIKLLTALGGLILILAMTVGAAVLSGVIIQDAWGWFIVPLGAPPIILAHAIGLSAFIAYFKAWNPSDEPTRTPEENLRRLGSAIATALMSWAVMALIASFMP